MLMAASLGRASGQIAFFNQTTASFLTGMETSKIVEMFPGFTCRHLSSGHTTAHFLTSRLKNTATANGLLSLSYDYAAVFP